MPSNVPPRSGAMFSNAAANTWRQTIPRFAARERRHAPAMSARNIFADSSASIPGRLPRSSWPDCACTTPQSYSCVPMTRSSRSAGPLASTTPTISPAFSNRSTGWLRAISDSAGLPLGKEKDKQEQGDALSRDAASTFSRPCGGHTDPAQAKCRGSCSTVSHQSCSMTCCNCFCRISTT